MKLCFNPTFHAWPPPSPIFPITSSLSSRHGGNISWMPRDCRRYSSLHGAAGVGSLPLKRISRRRGKPWKRWCLGLAHDENWFGLKLKHPTQVDVKNGCLGFAHVGLELGLKLEPRPKLWWWWCLGLKLELRPKLLVMGLGLSWNLTQACWWGGLMAPQTSHPHGPSPC